MSNRKLAAVLCILIAGFCIVGEIDYQEAIAQEKVRTAWLQENCLNLGKGQKAVVTKRTDGSVQCAKYEHAGFAGSQKLVYAEVR